MDFLSLIFNILFAKQKKDKVTITSKPSPKTYITLNDWITSSGRYPERATSNELTEEVKQNATNLINRVNALLDELNWKHEVSISSGFRPSEVNSNTKGAAKKSAHMTGHALDILQNKPENTLGQLIRSIQINKGKNGLLGKHGLMMESLESTIGKNTLWVHLDDVIRSERPSMEFKP